MMLTTQPSLLLCRAVLGGSAPHAISGEDFTEVSGVGATCFKVALRVVAPEDRG